MEKEIKKPKNIFGSDSRLLKKAFSLFLIIGIITLIIAFLSLWGGRKLDSLYGTSPWIMIGLGIGGFLLVALIIVKMTKRVLRELNNSIKTSNKTGEDQND
ncbi:MAG TPA: AtpZ/AtpI family protein [Flexilinea sp.]|jgi:amino acid transporter|nr:AtpZ/AtpI family protein [Flexilinea sp.]HOP01058.1 AtpZ/AtpI family protein [Flexilinea sp.]HOU20140.1 AtpZ/AtpI family protein [Flexilinea sp.]HPL58285.1 AtpZ/AtpI family protein [Flexilinea sp.]HPR71068.1 AtpZ/AtpI family protein [Flexilinea sp.]